MDPLSLQLVIKNNRGSVYMKNNISKSLMNQIVQYYIRPKTEIISIKKTSLRDVIIEFPVSEGVSFKRSTMTLNLYRITENHYHIAVATWLDDYEWVGFDEVPISTIDNIEHHWDESEISIR
jgi:hypothetical protein